MTPTCVVSAPSSGQSHFVDNLGNGESDSVFHFFTGRVSKYADDCD